MSLQVSGQIIYIYFDNYRHSPPYATDMFQKIHFKSELTIHMAKYLSTQVNPDEIFTEQYTIKTNSSLYTAFKLNVDSVNKRTMIMT